MVTNMDVVGDSLRMLAATGAEAMGGVGYVVLGLACIFAVVCVSSFAVAGSAAGVVSGTNAGPAPATGSEYEGGRDPEVNPAYEMRRESDVLEHETAVEMEPNKSFDPMRTMRRRSRFD